MSSGENQFLNLTKIRLSLDDRCLETTKIVLSQEGFQRPRMTDSQLDRTANPKMTVVLGLAVTDLWRWAMTKRVCSSFHGKTQEDSYLL